MAISKVVYGDETLIDISEDTITADDLAQGKTAHDASGEKIMGTKRDLIRIREHGRLIYSVSMDSYGDWIEPISSDVPNTMANNTTKQFSWIENDMSKNPFFPKNSKYIAIIYIGRPNNENYNFPIYEIFSTADFFTPKGGYPEAFLCFRDSSSSYARRIHTDTYWIGFISNYLKGPSNIEEVTDSMLLPLTKDTLWTNYPLNSGIQQYIDTSDLFNLETRFYPATLDDFYNDSENTFSLDNMPFIDESHRYVVHIYTPESGGSVIEFDKDELWGRFVSKMSETGVTVDFYSNHILGKNKQTGEIVSDGSSYDPDNNNYYIVKKEEYDVQYYQTRTFSTAYKLNAQANSTAYCIPVAAYLLDGEPWNWSS